MIFGYFTLFVALIISAVAAYYSIVGLTAIFSAAVVPIMIMGGSLEIGKLVAAVWLKLNWHRANFTYKLYLVPAVAFLMLLTSMGIFGFLSKAHSDQSLVSGDSMAKVAIYDEKIKISKDNIDANRKALKQMDEAVDQVMGRSADEKGADKAVAIRRGQQKERARLLAEIQAEQKTITALGEEAAPLRAEFRKVESEVGPIKYIAALVYGDNPDSSILEKAVRLVIMIIVAVFDPLALVLILAAQQSIKWAREEKENKLVKSVPVDEQTAVAPVAVEDAIPTEQKVETEPQTTDPATVDLFAYLKKPFIHFSNLPPMVHKTEPSDHTIFEDTKAAVVDQVVTPEIYAGNPKDFKEPWSEEEKVKLVKVMENLFDQNKQVQDDQPVVEEVHIETPADPQPEILAMGVDVIERPGDYVTPPSFNITADNVATGTPVDASFGIKYPENPKKGDLFVRVDFLPTKLFRFNGHAWIEIDKNATDSYAYNEKYIQHLAEQVELGQIDIEDLNAAEQDQMYEYLKQKRV